MADITITPNMGLPVPVPSVAPGPAWATDFVADMYAIDSHTHVPGQGVQIPPSGLNINADLPFGSNNATALKSARFTAQGSPLAGGADLGCIYVSGADLYYNDESGNQVRITSGGNVNAGAGSITGLPSGTASVTFAAGTYTFQSATNTGATISCGPVAIGSTTASAKQTTLACNPSQAANITLVLPTAPPSSGGFLRSDTGGNMEWRTAAGSGAVVLDSNAALTTPTFVGTPLGTVTSGTYAPTVTSGGSGTGQAAVANFFYHRIGNIVTASGWLTGTPSAGAALTMFVSVPVAPSANFSAASDVSGLISGIASTHATTSDTIVANGGSKLFLVVITFSSTPGLISFPITFTYSCA